MLTNANIKKYIEELRLKVEEKAIVNIDMVVKELAAIAFTDRTKIAKLVKKTVESKDGKKIEYEDIEFAYTDDLEEIAKYISLNRFIRYSKMHHRSVKTYLYKDYMLKLMIKLRH